MGNDTREIDINFFTGNPHGAHGDIKVQITDSCHADDQE